MQDITPERDASLGLVFRLNNLWSQADYYALKAEYDKWDNVLDCIYRNLLYRNELEVKKLNNKLLSVELSTKDTEIYSFLSRQIHLAKNAFVKSPQKLKSIVRSKWYHAIQRKDIWLRKDMQKLKLYLKEYEKRPGDSTFGRGSRK